MDIIYLASGLVVGGLIAWFLAKKMYHKPIDNSIIEDNKTLNSEKSRLEGQLVSLQSQYNENKSYLDKIRSENQTLREELAGSIATHKSLQEKLETQQSEIVKLQEKFSATFENLANKIFEEKSKKFTEQNSTKIDTILKPLNEKIKDFEKTVQNTYEKGLKERSELQNELKNLKELNKQISEDAINLTKALKGESKIQGDWGEMILERILESSGLLKDTHYKMQENVKDEQGKNLRPDAIIYLPDDKHLLIDSKVSLVAYERVINCEDKNEQDKYLKEHLVSVKKHIDELSLKSYQNLPGLNSPEYVLMFIPVEASFGVAFQYDKGLFDYAWKRKVVIVSPSTLIATLLTISSIWKQELQTRNAIEIADRGGKLYDKFVGFIEDLRSLGSTIEKTKKEYDQAMNKLSSGSGNLIGQAEKLRKLGAKATKELPEQMNFDEIPD
ncbi:MAG TPA: DNA recombination protein RmuC [Bacteroidales bacterium]|nr:DNA recombination protein RmuC [Bacteroidales bacterium]